MKRIHFSDESKADIRAIPQHIAMNILTAIHRLAENGAGRVKQLQGSDRPEFRLPVGDYRVRFTEADTFSIQPSKTAKMPTDNRNALCRGLSALSHYECEKTLSRCRFTSARRRCVSSLLVLPETGRFSV